MDNQYVTSRPEAVTGWPARRMKRLLANISGRESVNLLHPSHVIFQIEV
ncbi:MAG TPA: hypothetical protein VGB17_17270 [Pyrinomonadaceae bacterium]